MQSRYLVMALAGVICLSIVSPALGGPSIGSVAKTAKKALSTAKKANNRALVAMDDADVAKDKATAASQLASTANSNAGVAMARGQITVVRSAQVFFGPDFVKSATAVCPAGQKAISGGGASISDEEIAVTESTSDRSGWYVIGVDLVEDGGEYVQATALCAPSGQAVAANRAAVRAEVARKVRQVAKAAKSCGGGYTHAVMPDGSHKCLRAGQFCSRTRAAQRVYHRHGFHCKANGHLGDY